MKAKFARFLELIEQEGPNFGMPLTRKIQEGLFEIRIKANTNIGRIFFCYAGKKEITVLHRFIKKSQKTPIKEINIALKRLEIIKNDLQSHIT